jgi:hypothetical protein
VGVIEGVFTPFWATALFSERWLVGTTGRNWKRKDVYLTLPNLGIEMVK